LKVAEKREEKAIIEVCPLCGSKMEKGFITIGGGRPISWSKTPLKSNARSTLLGYPRGLETIVAVSFWARHSLQAYRCRKCKIMVFKYGETCNPAGKPDEDGT